jgi:hypothetical protein
MSFQFSCCVFLVGILFGLGVVCIGTTEWDIMRWNDDEWNGC